MGTYFENEVLDALWARLVTRVTELTGTGEISYSAGTVLLPPTQLSGVIPSEEGGAPYPAPTSAELVYPVQAGKKYLLNGEEIIIPSTGIWVNNNDTHYKVIEDNIIHYGKLNYMHDQGSPVTFSLIAAEDVIVPNSGLRQMYRALKDKFNLRSIENERWWDSSEPIMPQNRIAQYLTAIADYARALTGLSDNSLTLAQIVEALENYSEEPIVDENGYIANADGTYTLARIPYEEGQTEVRIAGSYNDKPVTAITATNLANNTAITTIILEEGIEEVGPGVFQNCNNVHQLSLPNTLKKIGASAFIDLLQVQTLTIPSSIEYIAEGAFSGMERLQTIESFDNDYYYVRDNCLISKSAPKTLILGCNNSIIPQDDDIVRIGKNAFEDCHYGLSGLRIPSTVKEIGNYAFDDCSDLGWIILPKEVKIGYQAFKGCKNIQVIYYEGDTISDWNSYVQIAYSEDPDLSNKYLITIPKAFINQWSLIDNYYPLLNEGEQKLFLFTTDNDNSSYMYLPNHIDWPIIQPLIKGNYYYIENTRFIATQLEGEGYQGAPPVGTTVIINNMEYVTAPGGPAPCIRPVNLNHPYPEHVNFYWAVPAKKALYKTLNLNEHAAADNWYTEPACSVGTYYYIENTFFKTIANVFESNKPTIPKGVIFDTNAGFSVVNNYGGSGPYFRQVNGEPFMETPTIRIFEAGYDVLPSNLIPPQIEYSNGIFYITNTNATQVSHEIAVESLVNTSDYWSNSWILDPNETRSLDWAPLYNYTYNFTSTFNNEASTKFWASIDRNDTIQWGQGHRTLVAAPVIELLPGQDDDIDNWTVNIYNPYDVDLLIDAGGFATQETNIVQRIAAHQRLELRIGTYWDIIPWETYYLVIYNKTWSNIEVPAMIFSFKNDGNKWFADKSETPLVTFTQDKLIESNDIFHTGGDLRYYISQEDGISYYLENTLFTAYPDQIGEGYYAPLIGTRFTVDNNIYEVIGHVGGNGIEFTYVTSQILPSSLSLYASR